MVRRKHSPKFKAMVAIEAIKAEKTISQINIFLEFVNHYFQGYGKVIL
ncbi:MAG: hypothetical protein J7J44_08060 [Deltaproteobacteria bacterium]|nr:hypothetical protein [Deltaproteobacteria bacterium]